MNRTKIKAYFLWILLAEAVGGLAGWLTREDVKIYTDSIAQPPLSPPALVFPVAWTILYALMGIGAARLALASDSPQRSRALAVFGLQLGMNFLWSILFFKFQLFGFSLLWLIALWGPSSGWQRPSPKLTKPPGGCRSPIWCGWPLPGT